MRVLFICLDNYPRSGACANILKNFCVFGNLTEKLNVQVLTIKNSYLDVEKEVIDGVTVHRVYIPELIALGDFQKRKRKNILFDADYYLTKIKKKVLARLMKGLFIKKGITNCTISNFTKAVNIKDFSVIVAIAGHFNAFDIALDLKNDFSYNGKLIFIQVDPCASNFSFPLESVDVRRNFEQKVFQNVNIIFCLPEQYKEYKQNHSLSLEKMKKIEVPNIVIGGSTNYIILDEPLDKYHTSCVFTGSFYSNIRDPKYMLEIFRKSSSKLFIVGSGRTSNESNNANNNIIYLGRKSLTETKSILNSADFLVNLGNSVSNQVPSKIFDYISSGKPIIHIRKLENDPSMVYLSKYPLCLDLYEGDPIEMNLQKLEAFIKENKGKTVPADYIAETYRECTPEYVANQLYEAILEVTGNKTEHWSNEHNENEVDAENRTVPTPDTSREEQLS